MRLEIRQIEFYLAQDGWVCDLTTTVKTRRQFTSEWPTVRGVGRWWLTAYLNAYLAAFREHRRLQALPGAFSRE